MNQDGLYGIIDGNTEAFFGYDEVPKEVEIVNYTGIEDASSKTQNFNLINTYPNPFNSTVIIEFNLMNGNYTKLNIYNSLGQYIRTIYEGTLPQGIHTFRWDGRDSENRVVASGVYYCTFFVNGVTQKVKKMTYSK